MTSRYFKPRTYYLLALGLIAVAFEVGRHLTPRLRKESKEVIIEVVPEPAPTATPTGLTKVYENGNPVPSEKAAAKPKAKPSAVPATDQGDDLTQIKGIGPTYAQRLREAGLTTYADVAAATPEQLRAVTKAATRTDVNEWIAAARAFRQN